MAKSIRIALYVLLLLLAACHTRFQPGDKQAMKAYINEPSNGLLQETESYPFKISLQYLPAAYLQQVQSANVPIGTGDEIVTFQLRITGANGTAALPTLLQQNAPAGWSASQQRHALFYGFEQVCKLHLGNQVINPLFATVEMTTQIQREISVVVVFPMTAAQLRQHTAISMTLLPTFFLKSPKTFTYNTNDLLAVYPRNTDVSL